MPAAKFDETPAGSGPDTTGCLDHPEIHSLEPIQREERSASRCFSLTAMGEDFTGKRIVWLLGYGCIHFCSFRPRWRRVSMVLSRRTHVSGMVIVCVTARLASPFLGTFA